MRIISKFRDFYDSCQNPADTFVWVREQREIHLQAATGSRNTVSELRSAFQTHCVRDSGGYMYQHYIVGFCGQILPMVKREELTEYDRYTGFAKPVVIDFHFKPFIAGGKQLSHRERERREKQKHFFDIGKDFSKFFMDVFFTYKVPVFCVYEPRFNWETRHSYFTLELNPKLANFQWYKKFDTPQCYQEIEMFLQNNLVDDAVDKVKIDPEHRKGARFDKWSFRRLPEKKR